MTMKITSFFVTAALVAFANSALASDLVELTDEQLDGIRDAGDSCTSCHTRDSIEQMFGTFDSAI